MSLLLLISLLGQPPAAALTVPAAPAGPPPVLLAAEPVEDRKTGFDFMVASPLGVTLRLQHRLNASPLYIEGYLGSFLLGAGAGVGLRTEFTSDAGPCDVFVARPGADFYYIAFADILTSSSSAGALVVDVDLAWQHRYAGGTIGELGVKLGPGVSFERNDVQFFPVFGIYHGWRF